MRKRLECTVRGRVQGVMFRDHVQRNARKLALVGIVKNNPDRTVSVIAEGAEKNLKKLEELLWKGPVISRMVARVDKVDAQWGEPTEVFEDFRILY